MKAIIITWDTPDIAFSHWTHVNGLGDEAVFKPVLSPKRVTWMHNIEDNAVSDELENAKAYAEKGMGGDNYQNLEIKAISMEEFDAL